MIRERAFRVKRAQDNVLRLAREWSKAETAWLEAPGETPFQQEEEDRLYDAVRNLRKRLEAACHELVAVEAET